jgi:hypothetical protein
MNETTEKKRGILLTGWMILILLANSFTALSYFLGSGFFATALPIPLWSIYTLGLLALFNTGFAIFLFKWKKWAFFAFCGNTVIVFVINLSIGLGFGSISDFLRLIILYLILRPKWSLLE